MAKRNIKCSPRKSTAYWCTFFLCGFFFPPLARSVCCLKSVTRWWWQSMFFSLPKFNPPHFTVCLQVKIPVAMHMRGTECKAVMEQGWVNDSTVLRMFHQFCKVAEMSVTPPHPITGTVLIQHKDLARTKPPLQKEEQQQKKVLFFLHQHSIFCRHH